MRLTPFIVIGVVLFGIIGDLYFRDAFRIIGISLTVLFLVFLSVHSWMDRKGMFKPEKLYKNKNKES